jgi:hypothetical protein
MADAVSSSKSLLCTKLKSNVAGIILSAPAISIFVPGYVAGALCFRLDGF